MRFITAAIRNAYNSMSMTEFFEWQESYINSLEEAGTHPDFIIQALDIVAEYLF